MLFQFDNIETTHILKGGADEIFYKRLKAAD